MGKSPPGLGRKEEKVRVATEKLLVKEVSIKRVSALHHNKEKGTEGISILGKAHPSRALSIWKRFFL